MTDVAQAEARISRILAAKGRDALPYLHRKGRERFLRELHADGDEWEEARTASRFRTTPPQ